MGKGPWARTDPVPTTGRIVAPCCPRLTGKDAGMNAKDNHTKRSRHRPMACRWNDRGICWAAWTALAIYLATLPLQGTGYLSTLGPPPLRFLTIPGRTNAGFEGINIVIDLPDRHSTNLTAEATAPAPDEANLTSPVVSAPAASGSTNGPAVAAASTNGPVVPAGVASAPSAPPYEFVFADPLLAIGNTNPAPAGTNTVGPASDLLLVTPQMLVEFFKPVPGVTNTAPLRVVVPMEVEFQPPLARPPTSSQAIYRSP